jgi:hypothetical protein
MWMGRRFRIALASALLLLLAGPAGWNLAAATWSQWKNPAPPARASIDVSKALTILGALSLVHAAAIHGSGRL